MSTLGHLLLLDNGREDILVLAEPLIILFPVS